MWRCGSGLVGRAKVRREGEGVMLHQLKGGLLGVGLAAVEMVFEERDDFQGMSVWIAIPDLPMPEEGDSGCAPIFGGDLARKAMSGRRTISGGDLPRRCESGRNPTSAPVGSLANKAGSSRAGKALSGPMPGWVSTDAINGADARGCISKGNPIRSVLPASSVLDGTFSCAWHIRANASDSNRTTFQMTPSQYNEPSMAPTALQPLPLGGCLLSSAKSSRSMQWPRAMQCMQCMSLIPLPLPASHQPASD